MQAVEHAVIAAAGLGSRLGHGMPKCMIELGGQTLITRLITSLKEHVGCIHVVVGYREELVIKLCANAHRDVVIVRNPNYRTTNTVQSMAMGARGCSGKTLFMDGDLLVSPDSLANFIARAANVDLLIGVADARSEDAVFVDCIDSPSSTVSGFTRASRKPLEWANVVACWPDLFVDATGYVFETLAKHLPAPSAKIELREVDTQQDLIIAREFAKRLDESKRHEDS